MQFWRMNFRCSFNKMARPVFFLLFPISVCNPATWIQILQIKIQPDITSSGYAFRITGCGCRISDESLFSLRFFRDHDSCSCAVCDPKKYPRASISCCYFYIFWPFGVVAFTTFIWEQSCFSCICLFILHVLIFVLVLLLLGTRDWLQLVIVAFPALLLTFLALNPALDGVRDIASAITLSVMNKLYKIESVVFKLRMLYF